MTTIAFILMGLALLLVATSNGVLTLNNRKLTIQAAQARRTLFQNWQEISRCQKANAALRERVGEQRVQILDVQAQLRDSQRALEAAQNAAQQPLPVDPDQEPTFAEIVNEVASRVSSLTELAGIDPAEAAAIQQKWREINPVLTETWAPEPVNQVVAGTIVTTPDHISLDDSDSIDGMD